MDQQRISELALLAQQRLAVPDVAAHQVQCVRYANMKQSMPGNWVARQDVGPEMDGVSELRMRIVEAPAEFTWPIRLGRCFKPAFKVSISVTHTKLLDLPVQLQAHLLSDAEVDNIMAWNPVPTVSSKGAARVGPSAMLCGTLSRTAIIEAGKRNQWSHITQSHDGSTDAVMAQAGHQDIATFNLQNQQRLMQISHGLGLPSNSDLLFKAQGQQQNPYAGQAPMQQQHSQQQQQWNGPGRPASTAVEQQDANKASCMVTQEEFAFSDLRFAKPSRMSPVYIVFTCTIPSTGDQLIVLYSRPTVCTCRAEQWAPACTRLGLPDIAAARQDAPMDLRSPGKGSHDAMQSMDTSGQMQDDEAWHSSAPAAPSTSVVTDLSKGTTLMHHPQRPQVETLSSRNSGGSNGSGPLPQLPQQQSAPLPQPTQIPPLPQVMSMPFMSMTPVDYPAAAREVVEWCNESFNSLGLTRGLTDLDLQALVASSGVVNCPASQALENLERFRVNFKACLAFMRYIASLWNRQMPCVIAGFAITKDFAGRRLTGEPIGTFICRLSASSPQGGMALAVRVAHDHPHAGPDGVLHCLVTKADLAFNRSVQTLLRDHGGTTHLLDVCTGKRMDKRKVFASDYMRLNDILGTHKRPSESSSKPTPQPSISKPLYKTFSTAGTHGDHSMTPSTPCDSPSTHHDPAHTHEGQGHSGSLSQCSQDIKPVITTSMNTGPQPSSATAAATKFPRVGELLPQSHSHPLPQINRNKGPLPSPPLGLRASPPLPIVIGDAPLGGHVRQPPPRQFSNTAAGMPAGLNPFHSVSFGSHNSMHFLAASSAAMGVTPTSTLPMQGNGHSIGRSMQPSGDGTTRPAHMQAVSGPLPTVRQSHSGQAYQIMNMHVSSGSYSILPPDSSNGLSFNGLMMSSGANPMSLDSLPRTLNMQHANALLGSTAGQGPVVVQPQQQQPQQQHAVPPQQQQQAAPQQHPPAPLPPIAQGGPMHSVSQMFLDSASLDVAALLDSMAASSLHGSMHDSMALNTDEQEFAAALLGD